MKALIEIDVPEWQIGQEVTIYFPDSMCKKGVCKENKRPQGKWIDVDGDGSLWKCSKCGEISCCRGKYCSDCGRVLEPQDLFCWSCGADLRENE